MSARDQGSRPSTIWTPRDHNLMAKDVDEPHGNRQQRISGVAVAGRGPSPDGHGCGRSHFRHRDRFVAGTCQLLGQRLRLLRQSGRQYALCGDQRADHRRRPVMQRREEQAGEHDHRWRSVRPSGGRCWRPPKALVRESRSVSGASAQRSAFERGGRPVRNRPCRGGNNMEMLCAEIIRPFRTAVGTQVGRVWLPGHRVSPLRDRQMASK